MTKKISLFLLTLVLAVGLSACGSENTGKKTVKAIDCDVTEGKIILQMAKMLVEQDTDYGFEIAEEMQQPGTYKEVKKGNADIFNTWDGTILTTLLHLDPKDVPEGETLYDFTNKTATEKDKVTMLDKLGHNNTYVMAVRKDIADKYNLKTTSDLAKVSSEIVFGAEQGFFTEEGSMKYVPYTKFYGLKFKDAVQFDLNLKYQMIKKKEIDATVAYATDGMIIESDLVMLEDDKKYFPDYYGVLAVRSNLFEDFGEDLKTTLNKLAGRMPNDKMVKLTYQVDVEGKTPEEVAKQFLKDEGLLK